MSSRAASGLGCVSLVGTSCLPPAYVPEEGEEMLSLVSVERWSRNNEPDAAEPSQGHAIAALVTWRFGQEAPLPRAWFDGDCLVTEGTWTDTEFSPPSHGELSFQGAADGDHTLTVTATDQAGHVGSATRTFSVDTRPLELTFTSVPTNPANPQPTIAFTIVGVATRVLCRADNQPLVDCTSPWTVPTPLADGWHDVTVRASFGNGIHNWTSRMFFVDTTP